MVICTLGLATVKKSDNTKEFAANNPGPNLRAVRTERDCAKLCDADVQCEAFAWEPADFDCDLYANGPYTAHTPRTGKTPVYCYAKECNSFVKI